MKIICAEDYADMSCKAADLLSEQIILKSDSILGLATGGTVLGIYNHLIQQYQKKHIDFAQIRTVNLDEYTGLSPDDKNSYHWYMKQNFFSHVNLDPSNCYLPDGRAESPAEECSRYEQLIASLGGIDLQLLGLGHNGHIGFNEPGTGFDEKTHLVTLSESTRQANSRFFPAENDIPKQAITMGIKSIMKARRILLCVSGAAKAEILQQVLFGPVTPKIPGSILQMHPDVTVIADMAACSCLPEEYRI